MEWDTRLKKPLLLGGGGTVPGVLLVLEDQGGAVMRWNYKELSPTLRSTMNHHEPIVVLKNDNDSNT